MGRSGYRPRGFRLLRIRAALTAENAEVALQLYDEMAILSGLSVIYGYSRYLIRKVPQQNSVSGSLSC